MVYHILVLTVLTHSFTCLCQPRPLNAAAVERWPNDGCDRGEGGQPYCRSMLDSLLPVLLMATFDVQRARRVARVLGPA